MKALIASWTAVSLGSCRTRVTVARSAASRACSRYLSMSAMRVMKAVNTRSVLSWRVKMRRKRLMRPKRRSISFLRLYGSVSYRQGSRRLCLGGATGLKPSVMASGLLSSPS